MSLMPYPTIVGFVPETGRVCVECGTEREWMDRDDLILMCGAWDSVACKAFHLTGENPYTLERIAAEGRCLGPQDDPTTEARLRGTR